MRSLTATFLFAGVAVGHYTIMSLKFDGTTYPSHNGPLDIAANVKRIEWWSPDALLWGYNPLTDISSPDITCQKNAKPPALKAVARAGSKVVVNWSNIVGGHWGPAITWMGRLESPTQKPQEVKFFKINEKTYDPSTRMWGNEMVIAANNTDTLQIPSDIKPGSYIFRTELIALHGNSVGGGRLLGGAQFYTHCFNVDILGDGTATPDGVTIPGAFKKNDPGLTMNVMTASAEQKKNYRGPGPAVYKGRYEAPKGAPPVVKATGAYPPELQKKYEALQQKASVMNTGLVNLINSFLPGEGLKPSAKMSSSSMLSGFTSAIVELPSFLSEVASLKNDATKAGL